MFFLYYNYTTFFKVKNIFLQKVWIIFLQNFFKKNKFYFFICKNIFKFKNKKILLKFYEIFEK